MDVITRKGALTEGRSPFHCKFTHLQFVTGQILYRICRARSVGGSCADSGTSCRPVSHWTRSPRGKGSAFANRAAALAIAHITPERRRIMAIYHCSIKKGKRSDGRSAVASSAYRAGARYTDQETGDVFNYSDKKAVVHHEVFLPEYAPAAYQSAETLWNAVQEVENKSNAVLFREFEVALPIEIEMQERISCAQEFCRILQKEGMCVQLNIHNLSHNPHAHIMCTTRKIKKDGKWDVKEKKDYVYVRDEDGRPVIGADGKKVRVPLIDPKTGEQKLRIRKGKGAEKLWKTEKTEVNEWNQKYKVEEWRAAWAEICNKYIDAENKKRKEREEREIEHVDHRSYKRQGIEQIPTIHEGYQARAIEREGGISEQCGGTDKGGRSVRSKEKYEELLERVRILEMETVEKMDEQADQIVQMTQEIKQLRKELKEKEEQISLLEEELTKASETVREQQKKAEDWKKTAEDWKKVSGNWKARAEEQEKRAEELENEAEKQQKCLKKLNEENKEISVLRDKNKRLEDENKRLVELMTTWSNKFRRLNEKLADLQN